MVLLKPTAAVKIGKKLHHLAVGKKVPAAVAAYWEKRGMIEALKKAGVIGENSENSGKKFSDNMNNHSGIDKPKINEKVKQ